MQVRAAARASVCCVLFVLLSKEVFGLTPMNRENFLESRLEDEQKISAHMYSNGLRAFSMVREVLYGCPSDATEADRYLRAAEAYLHEMLTYYLMSSRPL